MSMVVVGFYPRELSIFDGVAHQAVVHYPISEDSRIRLLNQSENTTYLVEDPMANKQMILRVNRPGYHTREELEAELCWMESIREHTSIVVPEPIAGKDGEFVQIVCPEEDKPAAYHCTLFHYLSGAAPDESSPENLVAYFQRLGYLTAQLHLHSKAWNQSGLLIRPVWDHAAMLGEEARWGRWQAGFGLTKHRLSLFQKVSDTIRNRLERFGRHESRFGLIHADLRLSNLLVDSGQIKVLDFDDCGYSWFLYDLASALSFIEHKAIVPRLIAAWLKGYEALRPLSQEEKAEIPTFIMLRRLLLLAWIGTHADSDTVREVGFDYTPKTEELARTYLARFAF